MGRKIILHFSFLMLVIINASGQQFTARGYWLMEHDSVYTSLLSRQAAGETLSIQDQTFINEFRVSLAAYFEKMPDIEKSYYYRDRAAWNRDPQAVVRKAAPYDEEQVYSGERSTYTKYIVSSGIWGGLYGASIDYILGIDGAAAAGIPLITGGLAAILPITTMKDKNVTTNSLLLSLHGKSMGAFQGAMLGLLISGQNNSEEGYLKLTAGIATASSMVLGRVGYNLGKNKPWTQGRVSLYSHYGWLMSLEGLSIVAAFNSEDPRLYGLAALAGGVSGYLIADRVSDRNNFTRGDITAVQTFSLLNGGLGFGILSDIDSDNGAMFLIPAAGALAGTIGGQYWMRNARLTNQQGRNIALATAGGAVVGLGLAVVLFEDFSSMYYILPYVSGLTTFALVASNYNRKNALLLSAPANSSGGLRFSIMPQNILINKKLISSGAIRPGSRTNFLPAFSATLIF